MGGGGKLGERIPNCGSENTEMFLPGKLFDQSISISLRCAVICDLSLR